MHAQPTRPRRRPLVVAAGTALVLLGVVGVAVAVTGDGDRRTPVPAAATIRPAPAPPGAGALASTPTPGCDPWGCDQQRRLAAAAALVRTGPSQLGITVLDRRTGAVWTAGTAEHRMWASSTPKLALATGLLERARTGELTLDRTARDQIDAMLAVSDDDAADALWDRFGGAALLPRFRERYGMTGLDFVPGFPRHVGPIQRWGVWAAAPPRQPGTKDGWSIESDAGRQHWCVSSVGFAGPAERYVVAVMDDLPPGSGLDAGVHAVSDVVATVFGAKVPAAVTVPDASTGR